MPERTAARPDPDELLARVTAEEAPARRGKLKIFFGYAAGVGKTYAMLEAAQRERAEGTDVVVGYVEPHGRIETEALVKGLEVLSPREVPYRGVILREFDLDAALTRRPSLILVDELAHTNAEGLRHAKRWQDVEELLEAGIGVFATLNVQHIESLNDVIAKITGVVVRETLPDSVLERADELELVDLTPEELIDRLKEGKVYVPQQAERALQHFFQRANLIALREISLRQVAQRLSKDVAAARRDKAAAEPWATNERLLVCVGPSPTSAKLIRTAKRMAAAFGADWLAVAIEPQGSSSMLSDMRQRVAEHLRFAEKLGAESHTLVGKDVASTVLEFARSRNVTKIIVGKSDARRWRRMLVGTVVDALLERSGEIDIYVIRGESEGAPRPRVPKKPAAIVWDRYIRTGIVVLFCGLLGWLSHTARLTNENTVMIFLLGVAYVAARYGRGPSIAAAIASVLVFDFFFVPPYLQFAVSDAQYLLTFAVMLTIGLLISTLTSRSQDQLRAVQQLQQRTAALFRLTKQLTEVAGSEFLIRSAGQQLQTVFDGEIAIFIRDADRSLHLRFGENTGIARNEVNGVVANWVADHEQVAGEGTDTLPNATALFAPLIGSQRTIGAVGVKPNDLERFADPDQRRLLETCASLIALSLERDQSVLDASEAEMRVKSEEMKNSLLSSVSHDLRTPLAVIAAASSSLLDRSDQTDGSRREVLQTIVDESHHLARLVDNLLDMTRLESGAVTPNKQWHVLEEIVGTALARMRRELKSHNVKIDIPMDVPMLLIDGVLIEQAFVNLLENAARYTPAGSQIEIGVARHGDSVEIRVADNGPGLPRGSESRVLEKFYRSPPSTADGRRGVGLGLAICQAIVDAHGGRIAARNRPGGGAEFVITIRCDQPPPRVVLDEVAAESGS
jgi:two-component system sensor histidine kinase KdpD